MTSPVQHAGPVTQRTAGMLWVYPRRLSSETLSIGALAETQSPIQHMDFLGLPAEKQEKLNSNRLWILNMSTFCCVGKYCNTAMTMITQEGVC